MRRFSCVLRRHDWHSSDDRETQMTWWECHRCGATKRGSGTDPTVRGMICCLR